MRSKAIFMALLAFAFGAQAVPVSREQAAVAVREWVRSGRVLGARVNCAVDTSHIRTFQIRDEVAFHEVPLLGGGVCYTSADTESEPIVAFSESGKPLTEKSPLYEILKRDAVLRHLLAQKRAAGKWELLIGGASPSLGASEPPIGEGSAEVFISDIRVAPLLKSRWGQTTNTGDDDDDDALACYNYYTGPYEDGSRTNYPCGCAATALAQIMYAFRFPAAFEWDKMVDDTRDLGTESEETFRAIGRLTADVGAALGVDYSEFGTMADPTNCAFALVQSFGYANACTYWDGSSYLTASGGLHLKDVRERVIFSNLDAGRPVMLGVYGYAIWGGVMPYDWIGHAVVADGYGFTEVNGQNTAYVHINLGWNGVDDAWYNIPEIDTTTVGALLSESNEFDFLYLGSATYNISTDPAAAGRSIVSGRVTGKDGAPVEGAGIRVFGGDGTDVQVTTGANGIYSALVPGGTNYDIRATYASPDGNSLVGMLAEPVFVGKNVTDGDTLVVSSEQAVGNFWGADLVMTEPAVRFDGDDTKSYPDLDHALAEATDGTRVEILRPVVLSRSVRLSCSLTITATNDNPRASAIGRAGGADIQVAGGKVFFTNVVFQAESSTPVRVSAPGVVMVAGTASFDDIVSRTPGILTDRPEGFVLAGWLETGITVDCSGKSSSGDRFGVYSCADAVAAKSAPRLVSSYAANRSGVAEGSGGAGVLEWSDDAPVVREVAIGYVDGDEPVYYRTLDQLFDEHPNGTNVVLLKSGLRLEKPRTLSGKQSIVAEDGAGEIVISPEGTAGFTIGAGCDLTVSGITFENYTGNGLFVVNGADAKLSVMKSAFRNIEGTNMWSGAIAIGRGKVIVSDSTFDNCRATGQYLWNKAVNSNGGAIYLAGSGCELELDGGHITGCRAKNYGGGIYAKGGSSVSVRGALTVRGNWSENNKGNDNIHLQNATATLTLAGKLDGTDAVGVRYGASASDKGNDVGQKFAAVADGADYASSLKAFFNDTNPDGTKAEADETGDSLLWAVRTTGDRNVDPDDVDATIRVTKGGVTQYYVEPEYAFAWIDADATVEVLKSARFAGDLVVTNDVKVTLRSAGSRQLVLRRRGETGIRVLPGASLTVTNIVLNGNGESSTIGLVKVESAAFELQAGAIVTEVSGKADRASGAISVWNRGTFTMRSGAEIRNCRNSYVNYGSKAGYGGGLLVEDHSTANLLGGSIAECAANRGGGVFIGTESTVGIGGDMSIIGNWDLEVPARRDNLCVADLSKLRLVGPLSGAIGYNEGRSGDTNVFGKVDAAFSGGDVQASAHNFTHDVTGEVGMAVSNGSETLLVWGSALDADGKYQEGDKTYSLVNGGEPLHELPEPAPSDFTYDGTAKTCLTDGVGYRVLAGNVATNVGNYTVVVTTRAGFAWDGGATGQREKSWRIEAAPYELKGVTFEDTTFIYDGTMKKLEISGTLPQGLSVRYENNIRWQPGTNDVTAVIDGSVPNYSPESFPIRMGAKLIIIDPEGKYHGETEPPERKYTVTTNDPSMTPLAFSNIVRIAENEWQLSLTNLLKDAEYALSFTDDLTTPFKTGEWFTAESDGPWTTNWIFAAEPPQSAYFWRAHGRTTYVTNWVNAVQPQP